MCDKVEIPEHLKPLYLPAPFLAPSVKGMIVHFDEESGTDSVVYPDTVWNAHPDPEKVFSRTEKNRLRKQYRKAYNAYKINLAYALSHNEEPPEPPVRPSRKHFQGDKSVPRFEKFTSVGHWETVPRGLTQEEEEAFIEKAWNQFENEQRQRRDSLSKWMTERSLHSHTQSFAFVN